MFASQPTTQDIMDNVRDHVQQCRSEPYANESPQNYIMRIVNDDAYTDVEKLYDGIEHIINANCKPIIRNMYGYDHQFNYTQGINGLFRLRSIIHKILHTSFVIDSDDDRKLIKQMYDMMRSVIKNNGMEELQVFTTNYDLVMEVYSEEAGFEIINGFKPYRRLSKVWDNTWVGYTDKPPLYLTKIHGSMYWHKDANGKIVETGSVAKVDDNRHIMIGPTEGAKDYSREPFSTLLDRFRVAIRDVDVLLVIGCSYRDYEIINIIQDGLKNGMGLISVSPDAAKSIRNVSKKDIQVIESDGQHLKAIGSQIILCEQEFSLDTINDVRAALDAAFIFIRRHGRQETEIHAREMELREMEAEIHAREMELREMEAEIHAREMELREMQREIRAHGIRAREMEREIRAHGIRAREMGLRDIRAREMELREMGLRDIRAREMELREMGLRDIRAREMELREMQHKMRARRRDVMNAAP